LNLKFILSRQARSNSNLAYFTPIDNLEHTIKVLMPQDRSPISCVNRLFLYCFVRFYNKNLFNFKQL